MLLDRAVRSLLSLSYVLLLRRMQRPPGRASGGLGEQSQPAARRAAGGLQESDTMIRIVVMTAVSSARFWRVLPEDMHEKARKEEERFDERICGYWARARQRPASGLMAPAGCEYIERAEATCSKVSAYRLSPFYFVNRSRHILFSRPSGINIFLSSNVTAQRQLCGVQVFESHERT